MADDAPVIGESWTDHAQLPHGTRAQIEAWLLAGPAPERLLRITATGPRLGLKRGTIGYARCISARGSLGSQHVVGETEFMRAFRRVPDAPPDPRDVPPELPR